MNMAPLYEEDPETGPEGRYGEFRLGEEELVVYDRENPSAWVRMSAPALGEGSATGS